MTIELFPNGRPQRAGVVRRDRCPKKTDRELDLTMIDQLAVCGQLVAKRSQDKNLTFEEVSRVESQEQDVAVLVEIRQSTNSRRLDSFLSATTRRLRLHS